MSNAIEWTEKEVAVVVRMYGTRSMGDIAHALGRTRNSVISKVNRLIEAGDLRRTTHARNVPSIARRAPKPAERRQGAATKAKAPPPVILRTAKPAKAGWLPDDPVAYLEAKTGQCMYMTDDPSRVSVYDLKVCGLPSAVNSSFCEGHTLLCYEPARGSSKKNRGFYNLRQGMSGARA